MAKKVRKQIYIERHQNATLKRLVKETGMSEAALIRRAIDRHTQSIRFIKSNVAAWEVERDFISDLIEQGPVSGQTNSSREELYER